MPYDEGVAERLRNVFADDRVVEKKMFGGLTFMLHGHMCCGIVGDELMVRVGPDGHEDALRQPNARPMDFTGKSMTGFVYVAAPGFADDDALVAWIDRARRFVATLPTR